MNEPSPQFEQQVRACFQQIQPYRLFKSCQVAELDGQIVVRIDSHNESDPDRTPTPYQVFVFDSEAGSLSLLSEDLAVPFTQDPGAITHATVEQRFPLSQWLTGIVEAACSFGAFVDIAIVSGNTLSRVGSLAVVFPHAWEEWRSRQVRMQLSIDARYHQIEFIVELRRAAFKGLGIPEGTTWQLNVSDSGSFEVLSEAPDDVIEFMS